MTIIPRDAFQEYLTNSIVKYFNENTKLDYRGRAFNATYKTLFDNNNKQIRESLNSFDGILVPEFVAEQRYVKYNNCNYVTQDIINPTTKRSTLAKTWETTMQLRLLCDTRENLGDAKLNAFIGTLQNILTNQEIVIYDFLNLNDTDLKIKWRTRNTELVNLNMPYEEYQEAIFTLDVWCDIYTEEDDSILLTHSLVLEPVDH